MSIRVTGAAGLTVATASRVIRPQAGPQEAFCACPADIAIYGGAAGSGKSFALCFEAARWFDVPGYNAVIFRRQSTEIRGGGGVWDEAMGLYPGMGATPREHLLEFRFPVGSRVEFRHLQHENDIYSHQSKQYAFIGFDEVTHFTEKQFWYLLSRNRSVCGVRPYVRATCNPDPDSFVRKLIDWWIGRDGSPIPERSGVVRYFVRDGDELVWGDTEDELLQRFTHLEPRSLTFIAARLEDNPALLAKDPRYRGNLLALPRVERERLLGGNWNIRPAAGFYFQRGYFRVVDEAPNDVAIRVRAWDRAATEPSPTNPDPDWTVGVRLSKDHRGVFYIEHAERFRRSPLGNETSIQNIASSDGKRCHVAQWQDPGSAGKEAVGHYARLLAGFTIDTVRASKDKVAYASPVSSQAEAGNICIVRGPWNDAFLSVLEAFPDGAHDDDVDALSLAFLVANGDDGIARLRAMTKM